MLRFEDPAYLWLLLIIPVLAVIRFAVWQQRKKKLRKFGDPVLLKEMMPDVSAYRPTIKFWLLLTAIAVLVLIIARPQAGTKISHDKRNGIEAIIALDISNSMLAEDVVPSRLEKSKLLVENLVDHFTNDKVGLVVFAGDAFVQLPITSDYVSAKMFLQNINPSLIATQGTDLARAITLSQNSFTQQDNVGKAIIVITDGEDHEGGALEAAQAAHKKGINVFILGIGDPKGSPIPDGEGGYMKDNSGQTVMSALNEQMCRQIAQAGSGTYIHVDNTNEAQEKLNAELSKLQSGTTDVVIYSEYSEQFQAFGIILLLLLVAEVILLESKNPLLKNVRLFKRKRYDKSIVLLLVCMLGGTVHAQTDRQYIRNGNKLFRDQNFIKAEVEYRKAVSKKPDNPQALYNLGTALLMQQKDSSATDMLQKAGKLETNKIRKSQNYHNIGYICQRHQMYAEAIQAYKEALRNNPMDNETRYNLALCKKLLKNNPQSKKQQKQKDKKDKNNKDNKDKKDKQQDQKKQDKNEQQKPKDRMSKDNAEQLLNAAIQNEKATQQRISKAMQQRGSRRLQKNW